MTDIEKKNDERGLLQNDSKWWLISLASKFMLSKPR